MASDSLTSACAWRWDKIWLVAMKQSCSCHFISWDQLFYTSSFHPKTEIWPGFQYYERNFGLISRLFPLPSSRLQISPIKNLHAVMVIIIIAYDSFGIYSWTSMIKSWFILSVAMSHNFFFPIELSSIMFNIFTQFELPSWEMPSLQTTLAASRMNEKVWQCSWFRPSSQMVPVQF
jgi:hypothetical protein